MKLHVTRDEYTRLRVVAMVANVPRGAWVEYIGDARRQYLANGISQVVGRDTFTEMVRLTPPGAGIELQIDDVVVRRLTEHDKVVRTR